MSVSFLTKPYRQRGGDFRKRTRRHIQAVKLILPKMPDTACVQSKLRAATAKAAVAMRGGIAMIFKL